ncbi:MAG: electron transport complex subunit RsxC, partial [Aeromonas sp.]
MQKLLARIQAGTLWDFHGGIHPNDNKTQSNSVPAIAAGVPPQLIIPLRQHAGAAGSLLVQVGDKVKKGQPLTSCGGTGRIVPVHASTSGTISAIDAQPIAHPSGLSELAVTLLPDGEDAWGERTPCPDFTQLERSELLARIQAAGIAGLGGAVFPTHSKLDGRGQRSEILIVNGLECEPYITTDDRLMQEHAREIMLGIRVLKHLLKPKLCLIGVEDNKPAAIAALHSVMSEGDIQLKVVPTKYPSGGAKQTIELLTGRQVPKGGRAVDIGIMVLNVATVFAIKRAIVDGEPLIERLVTFTGNSFAQPRNAWVRLGTPVRWLLAQLALQPEAGQRIIMGGPMMGITLAHAGVPVTKATNCLLAPTRAELPPAPDEQACIRCGACSQVCPASLLPQQLYWHCRAGEYHQAQALDLNECIECGACAWVCPSHIPLVQYYQVAKDEVRAQAIEVQSAERAKARFAAKEARLADEKRAREARHQQAAASNARPAAANTSPTANASNAAVAAALARMQAKKAAAPVSATADALGVASARPADVVPIQALRPVGSAGQPLPDNSAMIALRQARKEEAIA